MTYSAVKQSMLMLAALLLCSVGWAAIPAGDGEGKINREVWEGITGGNLSVLKTTIGAGTDPDSITELTTFQAPTNVGSNYGQRVMGYLHAPVTGNYVFWISSDDQSELYLSTDDLPGNKVLIANVPGWTSSLQWTKYNTQKSVSIALVAGQKYYIEAIMKEGGGGDNLAVAWEVGAEARVIIDGQYLSPLTEIPQPPDGEGEGRIGLERYLNISGSNLSGLNTALLNGTPPDAIVELTTFEAPTNVGSNFGQRVRGYLHAPLDGDYTFWIASDDNSELYLSTDEDPANKVLLANVPGWTSSRQWTKYGTQKSAPVTLEAGKKYYIEALHKEGSGGDNLAVAWKMPGFFQAIIEGEYLSPFEDTPLDPLVGTGSGSISRYVWTGISSNWLTALKNNAMFIQPNISDELTSFEAPVNWGNNFGTRVRGFLHAPVTGKYRFWMATDDEGELLLSTDANPDNAVTIATVPGWASSRQYNKYASQQSAEIELEAGKVYYIEALQKEGGGGDNLSVAWAPENYPRTVIDGQFLSPFFESGASGVAAIPAGTGSGTILREAYTSIGGSNISNLTNHGNYPANPQVSVEISTFKTPTNWSNNYGQRVHGYVHPPITGNYVFWISSDDHSQLWLSTDETEANEQMIASVNGHTSVEQWTKYSSQKSIEIYLEAGKAYYIKALHKEGGGGDNLAVAWNIPNAPRAVIDGQFLTPYTDGTPPAIPGEEALLETEGTPVVWTNFVGTVEEDGDLRKSASNAWGNGGAFSQTSFLGNGGVQFKANDLSYTMAVGLSTDDTDAGLNTIDFAVYVRLGQIQVYESGVFRGYYGSYTTDDILTVARQADRIEYKKNGVEFFTSDATVDPDTPYFADAAIYSTNGEVVDAQLYSLSYVSNFVATEQANALAIDLTWDVTNPALAPDFAGTVVRVSTTAHPATNTDAAGELLANNGTSVTSFEHTDLLSETTYYYSIFPIDTDDNAESPQTATATTRDLVSPDEVTGLAANVDVERVTLTWTNPDDSVYPNQDFTGVKIIRSTTASPATIEDGDEIADLTAGESTYVDTMVTGKTTYYYSVFAYDDEPLYSDPVMITATPYAPSERLVLTKADSSDYSTTPAVSQTAGVGGQYKIAALDKDGEVLTWVSGAKAVAVTVQYFEPSTGTKKPTIGTSELPNDVTLSFSNGVSAAFTLDYLDAGVIKISATMEDSSFENGVIATTKTLDITSLPQAIEYYLVDEDGERLNNTATISAKEPFYLASRAVASDGNNADLSDNLTLPNFAGTMAIAMTNDTDAEAASAFDQTGITLASGEGVATTTYAGIGSVTTTGSLTYYGQAFNSNGPELTFRPHTLGVEMEELPAERPFLYVGEDVKFTVSALDFEGEVLPRYRGTVSLTESPYVTMIKTYSFTAENQGSKEFIFEAIKSGDFKSTIKDGTFAELTSDTDEVNLKAGTLTAEATTVAPVGTASVTITMMDEFGLEIDDDSETQFLVTLSESEDNGSASSVSTSSVVTLKEGKVTIDVTNIESETVTFTPKDVNNPVGVTSGQIIFGGLQAGRIRRFIWVERKRREITEDEKRDR